MKNLRWITPSMITIALVMLGFIVTELRGTRLYAEQMMEKHSRRPHIVTEKKFDRLSDEINKLTIEVKLLRFQIKRNGGYKNDGN